MTSRGRRLQPGELRPDTAHAAASIKLDSPPERRQYIKIKPSWPGPTLRSVQLSDLAIKVSSKAAISRRHHKAITGRVHRKS